MQTGRKKKKIPTISFSELRIDNFLHNVELFQEKQPFFYDKNGMFWFWNTDQYKWEIVDETDIMIALEKHLEFNGQTVNNSIKNQYLESIRRLGRSNSPKEAPTKWVQFKDKAFSLRSGKIHNITSDYFFTNPLPYDMGKEEATPVMDKLFEEWVGKENVKTLYQLIAYCCTTTYPIHLIFCMVGTGRNGKTQFQKVLNKFIGIDNVCSTELDTLLTSRFESFKLFKKLVCVMGETNFGVMSKTSLLKKLTGEDLIGFEFKNKKPFDGYNYAKIVINSNSLPPSEDTSEGFYRRWMIVDFPNEFEEGKDIVKTIPEQEYNNLALKVTKLLPSLLEQGKLDKQGSIEDRKYKYILSSNPLPIFLSRCCDKGDDLFVSYNELASVYFRFLNKNKKRKVTRKEFKAALNDEGFFPEKTSKPDGNNDEGYPKYKTILWVDGVSLKNNWEEFANFANFTTFPNQSLYTEKEIQMWAKKVNKAKVDILKCTLCGKNPPQDVVSSVCKGCYGRMPEKPLNTVEEERLGGAL